MSKINVTIGLNYHRPTKKGSPVIIRVTHQRRTNSVNLGFHLEKEHFDKIILGVNLSAEDQKIKKKIDNAKTKANFIIDWMRVYSFQKFRAEFLGIKPKINPDSITYKFNEYIKILTEAEKFNTLTIYKNALISFIRFRGDINLSEVDEDYLRGYVRYMQDQNNSPTTTGMYLRDLRCIVNRNKKIFSEYPFENFTIPRGINNKRPISQENMRRIIDYRFKSDRDNLYLDTFVLSYLLGGMNIIDVIQLKHSNIKNNEISFFRSKTGVFTRLALNPLAIEIIERYRNKKSDFVLPFLKLTTKNHIFFKNKFVVKSINMRLRRVSSDLNLGKITTYFSRYSFVKNMIENDVNTTFISQCLGHAKIDTLNTYISSFGNDKASKYMNFLY